jgi:hypothetical protein
LSKKRHQHQPKPKAIEVQSAAAGILPFLERHSRAFALCFLAIGTIRIVSAYSDNGLTFDEPAHIACGLQYLAQHVYQYESQHPPLARAMTAIGPFLAGVRPLRSSSMFLEGTGVLYRDGHAARNLALARCGILVFFLLAGLVVYFWARRHFGGAVAAIGAGLFTLLPPVLAHAGLATTDMGLAACLGAAFWSALWWAEKPTWQRSVVLGAATGCAVLSKFTALGFFPISILFALLMYILVARPGWKKFSAAAKDRAAPFAIAVLTGALVIWAGYLFSVGKAPGWRMPFAAPELFDGIRVATRHYQHGGGYLLGRYSPTGWWYFFPVVLLVKTPIPFLLLFGTGCIACWKRRSEVICWLPLALAAGVLVPSMTSQVNFGVRHILAMYIGFSIVAAFGAEMLLRASIKHTWVAVGTGLLVLWMVTGGITQHPNYLAYFNELAGSEPSRVLIDSDFDWGQSTPLLARRLRELGATSVAFTNMNLSSAQMQQWPGMPPSRSINPLIPTEGWTVVSTTFWRTDHYGLDRRRPRRKPWFEELNPTERVGPYYLFYIPPGLLERL